MKYDIFISYSRKDTAIADKICAALDKQHISYFIDRQGIGGGMEFPTVIAESILNSQLMLYLASKNSYASKFTNNEVTFAFNKKPAGSIIPYLIDSSTLPPALEFTFSSINIRTISEHPIDTVLMKDICDILGKSYMDSSISEAVNETPIDTPNENANQVGMRHNHQRTMLYIAMACVAIIIVGAVLWFNTSNYTNSNTSNFVDSVMVNANNDKELTEQERTITEIVHKWDDYHQIGKEHLLSSLYANKVKFYGWELKRQVVVQKIVEVLDKNNYTQYSDHLTFTKIDSVTIRCDLYKNVVQGETTKMYPSYLTFNKHSGIWFIIEESDDVTDRNLGRQK